MPQNPPMYFASLEIKNIKCFGEKQVLDLRNDNGSVSPWTLILGNNGLGKTTLLKCLAWMNTVEEPDEVEKKKANIPEGMIAVKGFMDGLEDNAEYVQLARMGKDVTSVVGAELTNGVPLGQVPIDDALIKYSLSFKTANGELTDLQPKLAQLSTFNAPRIYAYSASRHMELKNTDRTDLGDPLSNLFSESGELFDATEQLLYQDHAALQEGKNGRETALLLKIKTILSDLLPGIEAPESISILAKERTVKIKTPDGEVSLQNLSLGYKTMVAWTVDLALKMLAANPESDNPLAEAAVVIIDEIDLHLHPKWQRDIKDKLTTHFPHTQFICTAHSPFMAQSSETENLCVLQRNENSENEVTIDSNPYIVKGWRIGQIITSDLFGVEDERSLQIENLRKERQALLDNFSLTPDQEQRLKELDEQLEALPLTANPEEALLLEQIRKTARLLNIEE